MSDERFSRIQRLLGAAGLQRLQQSFVTVVGLGAAGSYAVEGLARAGVGRLRLVDFDEVRASNINRQLYALTSTLGRKKAELARERVADINPHCQIEILPLFSHRETLDQVLAGPPDVLIDAIDSVTPKSELLAAAVTRGVRVVSCMGAALRTDPSCIRVGPMATTQVCPLARQIRHELRSRKVPLDFLCVYSTEAVHELPDGAIARPEESGVDAYARGRVRRALGSLPTVTGIVGLTAAHAALNLLLGR